MKCVKLLTTFLLIMGLSFPAFAGKSIYESLGQKEREELYKEFKRRDEYDKAIIANRKFAHAMDVGHSIHKGMTVSSLAIVFGAIPNPYKIAIAALAGTGVGLHSYFEGKSTNQMSRTMSIRLPAETSENDTGGNLTGNSSNVGEI